MNDISRNVFVVHGRNLAARDATFDFLQALDLKPLTWERSAALSGKAVPTTLEGVEAGMRQAQAVVVLMTGDDLARLRNELGRDPPTTQPRPNVLIEAGMALSLLGRERVVLVRSGAAREITDFSGLNYVDIDNTPAKRQALASRLDNAGCPVDRSGDQYLDSKRGGDFERAFGIDKIAPHHERGSFDGHIVDSTMSYRCSNIKLLEQLEQQLENPGVGDLKYNYLGVTGAANWLNLSKDEAYLASESQGLIMKAIARFFANRELAESPIDLISLGPGDGELDAGMIREICSHTTIRDYYPLDISVELLQRTVERTAPVCRRNRISLKAILGDFLELQRFKPIYGYDDAVNVVTLVGFTFGNYNESNLLNVLASALNSGDFAIIDARTHDLVDVGGKALKARERELMPRFRHAANNRFAFGPVEMVTTAEYADAIIRQELSRKHTVIEDAFNVVTYCSELDTQLRGGKPIAHERLDLAVTTFYNENELVEFIEEREFHVVDRQRGEGTLALLLRRE